MTMFLMFIGLVAFLVTFSGLMTEAYNALLEIREWILEDIEANKF